MKKERILDTLFTIIGVIGFLEFSFLRGLFTGPVIMIICGIMGIISFVYKIIKKKYHCAILYGLLFATIFFGYLNIM